MPKFIETGPVDESLQRATYIPSNIAASGLLSTTNNAIICFTRQQFSSGLQVFLVNYVVNVQNYYPIYK
jgi:hypothetical protein